MLPTAPSDLTDTRSGHSAAGVESPGHPPASPEPSSVPTVVAPDRSAPDAPDALPSGGSFVRDSAPTGSCQSGKIDRSKDIVGPVLPADFLERVVSGKNIALTLPDGQEVRGEVQMIERDGKGILYVQASIKEPSPGFCFLQRQTMEGVAGPMVGHVRFEGKDRAWKIEPTADLKSARFVDRILDEVLCVNYEKMPEVMEAAPGDVQEAPQTHPTDIPIPPYQTVIPLQSLPGATGVLYLDFDGENGSWSYWGAINAAPSGATNAQVFEVWKMVCEDYQGFNLNVTTDRKIFDAAAPGHRQQIIITPTSTAAPGAGGVAYVGSFNWSSNVPCWSFYSTGKNAAEVISHELGHTLGLSHDGRISPSEGYYGGHGSGSTGWAPIMGVGYYQNLSQWSKGEYLSADQTQDDLSIIANNNNDVGYRTDDAGDTLASARYLDILANGSVSNEGIIERTGDVDAFRFRTTGGLVTLNLNPVSVNPDLDIYAEIVNAATLSVIVSNNPDLAITASVSATLAAGEYLLRVRGTGRGDPLVDGYTNYGSLGTYLITGTVAGAVVADRFSIAENLSNGTSVGTVAARTNHGASSLTWSIVSGNSNGAFAINPSTGAITVANSAALNYEALSTRWDDPADFELFVSITDAANPALNESIRTVVSLTNVNEAPVMSGGSVTVLEGSVVTDLVTVVASDPDRFDYPTFSIVGGDPGGIFSIDSVTGAIRFVSTPVFSQSTDFNLSVRATDHGSPALATTVTYVIHLIKYTPVYSIRGDGKVLATFSGAGSGTWTVPAGVTSVEVLVVGGGGGGGNGYSSGSGGGGMYYSASCPVTAGSEMAVAVGAGGVAGTDTYGGTGGTSKFGALLFAYGGTAGQGYTDGGDQGAYSVDGGATMVPGNLGMHYSPMDGNWCSGGGAGHAGYKGDGQPGGIGLQCAITGSNTYYAGGGGSPGNGSVGGLGGGGAGANNSAACAGGDGLGGGAGGSWGVPSSGGGVGGSGIVILAYTSGVSNYMVSFNSNGGSTVANQTVISGGTATLPTPAPTRAGYTFVQWCSDSGLTSAFNFSTAITSNTTLYAKWVENWVVTFNSNSGSAVTAQSVPAGGTATLPTPAPTRAGYTFVQWCSDSGLTSAFNFSTAITANTTLYAKWTANWVVTFNSNSGSSVTAQSVPAGGTATLPTPAPTRAGYTFVQWCSDSGLTSAFNFSTAITANTTLYAKWTINSYTLTYSAAANGTLTGITPQTVNHGGSGTAVTANPNSGYQFSKWSDNSTANPRTDSNVTANINVTASFELIPPPFSPNSTALRADGKTVATFSTVGSGTWTIPAGVTSMEVLVVGGGGSGIFNGGGGGSGGFFHSNAYAVTGGRGITVIVGAGAVGGASGGSAGSSSVFDSLTAYGGAGGTTTVGGASGGNNQGGTVYAGGAEAGGGGGAGQAGANAWYTSAKGGDGLSSTIVDGVNAVWYAGGGSCRYNGADGGLGGGGSTKDANSAAINVPNGVNGLGGGGAGGRNSVTDAGAGGSGIVIVAYQASPYVGWAGESGYHLSGGPADDDDGDGLTNYQEFAFGLDPTQGASSSPVRHLGGAHFSYTRYVDSGLAYTVWTSADLKVWNQVLPAAMTSIPGAANEKGVATVDVTLKSPPVSDKLFLRVQAQ